MTAFKTRLRNVKIKRLANVIGIPTITTNDMDPAMVLARALESNLKGVVVVGYDEDGDEYFASSYADAGNAAWLLDRAKYQLLKITDEFDGR